MTPEPAGEQQGMDRNDAAAYALVRTESLNLAAELQREFRLILETAREVESDIAAVLAAAVPGDEMFTFAKLRSATSKLYKLTAERTALRVNSLMVVRSVERAFSPVPCGALDAGDSEGNAGYESPAN